MIKYHGLKRRSIPNFPNLSSEGRPCYRRRSRTGSFAAVAVCNCRIFLLQDVRRSNSTRTHLWRLRPRNRSLADTFPVDTGGTDLVLSDRHPAPTSQQRPLVPLTTDAVTWSLLTVFPFCQQNQMEMVLTVPTQHNCNHNYRHYSRGLNQFNVGWNYKLNSSQVSLNYPLWKK